MITGDTSIEVVSEHPKGFVGQRKSQRSVAQPKPCPLPVDEEMDKTNTPKNQAPTHTEAKVVSDEEDLMNELDNMSGVPDEVTKTLFRLGHTPAPGVSNGLQGAYLKETINRRPPTNIPEAAREALVKSTRQQHVNCLKMLAKELNPKEELATALVNALQRLATARNWRQSTLKKYASSTQGAMKILPMYYEGAQAITLRDSPVWRMSLLTFQHRSKEELPNQPKAETTGTKSETQSRRQRTMRKPWHY